jgi:hypothetical protein
MPTSLQLEMAAGLRFVDDTKTGVLGCFSKVPFLARECSSKSVSASQSVAASRYTLTGSGMCLQSTDLEFNDLIRIGCCMQHQHAYPPVVSADGDVLAGFIMREGDRGNEMWIVADGVVRVERKSETGNPVRPPPVPNHELVGQNRLSLRGACCPIRSVSANCG